jgi:outer membrane receptor protein involved in Fe transport
LADPASNGVTVATVPNSGPGFTTFRFNRRGIELGTRNSLRDTSTFQISGGVVVDVGNDWTWRTEGQFGRSSITQSQTGNVSIAAVREAVLTTDGINCSSGNADCSPLNLFGGPNGVSSAAAAFISRTGIQYDFVEQLQIISTLGGEISGLKSPWAESGISAVFGVEYREEEAQSQPDSVLGPDVLGFNQSLPVGGGYDSYEAFMEADIPVFQDTAIGSFGINGAFRFSDFSSIDGGVKTWAVGGDWEPVDGIRFRAQFQHATRAPNIGELFSAFTNGFPGANDPCLVGGGYPGLGVDPALDALCISTGVPAALLGVATQSNGQIEALFGGNPLLGPEDANTLTIGGVFQPAFIDGLTLQVDFFNIKVPRAIGAVGLQTIFDLCYQSNVTAFCNQIVRDPATGETGNPGNLIEVLPQNLAFLQAKGIDGRIDYNLDLGSLGSASLLYVGSYTLINGAQSDPLSPFIDCPGTFAGNCGEPTPEYKHVVQAGWNYGALTTSVRWRYIGSVVVDPTAASSAGASDLSDDIGAFNYVDITLQYAVNENLDLTVGVQNILSKDPPILGSTFSEQANTFPATYDTLGRQLFFGASLKF